MCDIKTAQRDLRNGPDCYEVSEKMPHPALNLDDIFQYHSPGPEQQVAYRTLRSAAKHFAQVVLDCTPPCADQTAAIRKIREAVMTANAAVALRGIV